MVGWPDRHLSFDVRAGDVAVPLLLALLATFVFFWRLGEGSLYDWDEATYARTAVEMFTTRDLNTLHWNGAPFLEKPPLLPWLIALSYRIFGVNEFAARFPSALAGVAVILMTYALGSRLFDRRTGAVAALMLLTVDNAAYSHGYNLVSLGRMAMMDIPTILFSTTAFLFVWLGRQRHSYLVWLGIPLGLGIMTKSVMGLLPYGAIALYILLTWRRYQWPVRELALGFLLSCAIALPWHVGQYAIHGDSFLNEYLGEQVLSRATSSLDTAFHQGDALYYLRVIRDGFPVWWLAIVLGGAYGLWHARRNDAFVLLFAWIVVGLVVFSVAETKIRWYIILIYPALALVAACGALLVARGRLGLALLVLAIAVVGLRLPSPRDGSAGVKPVALCTRYVTAAADRILLLTPPEEIVPSLHKGNWRYWDYPLQIAPSVVFYSGRSVVLKEAKDASGVRAALPAGGRYVITDGSFWSSLGLESQVLCRSGNLVLASVAPAGGQ